MTEANTVDTSKKGQNGRMWGVRPGATKSLRFQVRFTQCLDKESGGNPRGAADPTLMNQLELEKPAMSLGLSQYQACSLVEVGQQRLYLTYSIWTQFWAWKIFPHLFPLGHKRLTPRKPSLQAGTHEKAPLFGVLEKGLGSIGVRPTSLSEHFNFLFHSNKLWNASVFLMSKHGLE